MVKMHETYNIRIKYEHLQTYQVQVQRTLGSCDGKSMGTRF